MRLFDLLFWTRKRIQKIRVSDVANIHKQDILAALARDHWDRDVQVLAVDKLDDQKILAQVAINKDNNSDVCERAVKRMTDQALLAEVAKSSWAPEARCAALRKITDRRLLTDICEIQEKDLNCAYVRLQAAVQLGNKKLAADLVKEKTADFAGMPVVQLLDDEEALAEIAKKNSEEEVCLAAAKKISTPSVLSNVAAEAQNGDVSECAMEMLQGDQPALAAAARNADIISCGAEDQLTDQALLLDVARSAKLDEVRLNAARRLEDQTAADEIRRAIALSESADPSDRKQAATELTSQEDLAELAMKDDHVVATAAAERLSDHRLLRQVAENAPIVDVRLVAAEKIGDEMLIERNHEIIEDRIRKSQLRAEETRRREEESKRGNYGSMHGYVEGKSLGCSRCGQMLRVNLHRPGEVAIATPGALAGQVLICNECGLIYCHHCTRNMGSPIPKCRCGGSITLPC